MATERDAGRCIDDDELSAFVEGRLSADRGRVIEEHADRCPACRQLLSTLVREEAPPPGPPAEKKERPFDPGSRVGRYVIEDLIGSGGMGVVLQAHDPELDRRVAVKIVRLKGATTDDTIAAHARLRREAQAMARLSHPNVVQVYEVGAVGDGVFVAMERIDGLDLARWLREVPRSPRQILDAFVAAGRGLEAAHAAGLVHRDFKPHNVLVGREGRPRVGDFGLALQSDPVKPPSAGGAADPAVTATALAGTPRYMAPEQWRGGRADARSDQFSFCVALYEALYGSHPFGHAARWDGSALRPPPRKRGVHGRAARALVQGLQVEPEKRCATMGELLRQLEPPQRLGTIAAVGVVTIAAALAAGHQIAQGSADPCRRTPRIDPDTPAWTAQRDAALAAVGASAPSALTLGRALDDYASGWIAEWRTSCRQPLKGKQGEPVREIRVACLDARADEVEALVTLVGRGGAGGAMPALDALARLPLPRTCARPAVRSARVQTPQDQAVWRQLSDARALLYTAQYDAARGAVDKAVDAARASPARALETEALLLRAELQWDRREEAIAETLRESMRTSQAAADDLALARSLLVLARVSARWKGKPEEARHWLELATGAIQRAGGDDRLSGELHAARGHVEQTLGRDDHALEERTRGVALLEKALGPEATALGDELADLCYAQYAARRMREDLGDCRRALALLEKGLGKEHPRLARALNALGTSLIAQGKSGEAIAALERAVAVTAGSHGRANADLAIYETNLGEALTTAGRAGEAEPHLLRALELHLSLLGPNHLDVAWDQVGLARNALAQQKLPLAAERARGALAVMGRLAEPQATLRADALDVLGEVELRRGKPRNALPHLREALAICERELGPENLATADALSMVGRALLAAGEQKQALGPLERAWAIREKTPGSDPAVAAANAQALSRALTAVGQRDRAAALAKRALELTPPKNQ
jgi:tetratricopeptide (TPR) repeat protein/tRNA A-37 threonylcarbamoyl transferase component Bud32